MKKRTISFSALLTAAIVFTGVFQYDHAIGQACPNIDFSMGNFTNWQAHIGNCCPISVSPTVVIPGRHTIMSTPGTDVYTQNQLSVLAPTGNNSARLGNDQTGAEAEGLSYNLTVTPHSALLLIESAVVLQDPGHTPVQQPRFEYQVINLATNQVLPCSFVSLTAGNGLPGFQNGQSGVIWKDWDTVAIDLSPYIGQGVQLQVYSGDCSQAGHFGYGYFRTECRPMQAYVSYCQGNTATFTAPEGFEQYQWSFNGTPIPGWTHRIETMVNPQLGTYQVQLTNINGCIYILNVNLTGNTTTTASFLSSSGCNGLVNFTDNSTSNNGLVNQWQWDFGDGSPVSTLQNPSHTYANAGTYTVQLLAYAQGCTVADTFTAQVTTGAVINPQFSVSGQCSSAPSFTNLSTVSSGSLTGAYWRFGDGSISVQNNPTHTYTSPGIYNVTLIVTSNLGCNDSITMPVIAGMAPAANFPVPQANCEQSQVSFLDGSIPYINTTLQTWQWNFDDGSPLSNTQHPTHTYTIPGTYNVELIVADNLGCTDTVSHVVFVYARPNVSFTAGNACAGAVTQLTDQSTIPVPETITNWLWAFNPSLPSSTLQNPTVVFPNAGVYQVTLLVASNHGCSDTLIQTITVAPGAPVAQAAVSDSTVDCYQSFQADASGSTNGNGFSWYFPGAVPPVSASVTENVYYQTPGIYPVTLVVTNACGSDSILAFHVTVSNCFSGNEDPKGYSVSVYPMGGQVILDYTGNPGIGTFQLYSSLGQLLYIQPVNMPDAAGKISVQVHGLAHGIYYWSFGGNDIDVITGKFLWE